MAPLARKHISRREFHDHAEKLKARLRVAYFKVQTHQEKCALAELSF